MRPSVRVKRSSVGKLYVVSVSLSSASLGLLVGPKGKHASKRPGERMTWTCTALGFALSSNLDGECGEHCASPIVWVP